MNDILPPFRRAGALVVATLVLAGPLASAEDGKAVPSRQVPEAVRRSAESALPDGGGLRFRILDNGRYKADGGRAGSPWVELGTDGVLLRRCEPVREVPRDVAATLDAERRKREIRSAAREWVKVTTPGDAEGHFHFQTELRERQSVYEVRIAPDGQLLGFDLIEARLQGGRGPKVRVSGGGAIVE